MVTDILMRYQKIGKVVFGTETSQDSFWKKDYNRGLQINQ